MKLGFVAHESKKKLMQNFCIAYRNILAKHELYATGTTGRLIEEATSLPVTKYLAGHLGGQHQLGSQIAGNAIDVMIYLREPIGKLEYEPDSSGIIRLCDIHNIPIATNLATAEVLIKGLDRGDIDWRNAL